MRNSLNHTGQQVPVEPPLLSINATFPLTGRNNVFGIEGPENIGVQNIWTTASTKSGVPLSNEQKSEFGDISYIAAGISGAVFFLVGILILLPIALKLLKKKRYARRYNSVPVELERSLCAAHNLEHGNEKDDEWRRLPTNRDVRISLESYSGCEEEFFDKDIYLNESRTSPELKNKMEKSQPVVPQPLPNGKVPPGGGEGLGREVSDMILRYIQQFQNMKSQYASPTNYACSNFAIGSFDKSGGLLELSNLDVSMYVPPGALPADTKHDLFMYVSWENSQLPECGQTKSPVSPVIWCGQHGASFNSHVVLSFPQNMYDESGKCKYRIMRSDTDVVQPAHWVDVTDTDDACVIPMDKRCLLLVNHFTGYAVSAECGPQTVKKLQVGVFGETLTKDDELYQLKVRVWADGSENPKLCMENALDDVRCLDTVNNGEPLCVDISKISKGWELDETYQEILFSQFWTAYSDSVTFMAMKTGTETSAFFTIIDVYQKNTDKASSKRKFKPTIKPQDPKPDKTPEKHENKEDENLNKRMSADEVFLKVERRLKPTERLCSQLREETAQKLSVLLDPVNPAGNDWRLLAEKCGLSYENIHWIKSQTPSPTLTVLHVMAALHKSDLYKVLQTHFTEMENDACLDVLKSDPTFVEPEHQMANLKLDLVDEETARKASGSSEESGYSSPTSSGSSSRAMSAEVDFEVIPYLEQTPCNKLMYCEQSGVPPSTKKSKTGYMV